MAVYPKPDGCITLQMSQGYFEDNLAWYVCTDTSDFRFSQAHNLTFAPKLDSAWGIAAPVYIVLNPKATQGAVFSAKPGDANYSGIWTVVLVNWTNLDARVPLKSEAQILAAEVAGDLEFDPPVPSVDPNDPNYPSPQPRPHIVVDYPIVALGPLGCPGQEGPGRYTIPQFINIDKCRRITLPTFNVNCSDEISTKPFIKKIIIPDVGDQALATTLGANLAPGLLNIDAANKQNFWVRRGPKPIAEMPIIEFCPNGVADYNSEKQYTPVMQYTILHSNIAPSTTVNNKAYLELLIGNGGLVVAKNDQVINAPVMPNKADIVVCRRYIDIYLFDWFLPDGDKIDLSINGCYVLRNCKLPLLLWPKCLDNVCLNPGENIIKITATSRGLLDSCSAGIAFSNVCRDYINLDRDKHVELFSLKKGECATITVRVEQ